MVRKHILRVHILASIVALVTILSFLLISIYSELFGNYNDIKLIKKIIIYTLPILIFSMVILVNSGNRLTRSIKDPLIIIKQRRMKFIFYNGIVLVFLAIFLYYHANYQKIDYIFFVFQILEFAFGLINITLMVLNAKDGIQLSVNHSKLQ